MKYKRFLNAFTLLQAILGLRVLTRFLVTARGRRIEPVPPGQKEGLALVAVVVPTLNEVKRLTPCLEGLQAQGSEVGEILIVDGGSRDGTCDLVEHFAGQDARFRLIDASPIPPEWNGKAWGLQAGLCALSPSSHLVLIMDADVRPSPLLTSSLLAQMQKTGVNALSVATLQDIEGIGQGLLHPSFLTTLVYRFGLPGHLMRRVNAVQANGQCFLFQRVALESCGGFFLGRDSLCEDVTIARALVKAGYRVAFYEAGDLVRVRMYENWQETWANWPRSLPLWDRFSRGYVFIAWLEVMLIQALPLPLFLVLFFSRASSRWLTLVNGVGALIRLGVLWGTARAYNRRPWSYWLSPLCDLLVAGQLGVNALRRRHFWRGRLIMRGGMK